MASWREVFDTWRDYVRKRPKTTTLACQTAWRALEAFARSRDVLWPAHATPAVMTDFVDRMRVSGLAPRTVNERLRKVRAGYRIAIGKSKLTLNPTRARIAVGPEGFVIEGPHSQRCKKLAECNQQTACGACSDDALDARPLSRAQPTKVDRLGAGSSRQAPSLRRLNSRPSPPPRRRMKPWARARNAWSWGCQRRFQWPTLRPKNESGSLVPR